MDKTKTVLRGTLYMIPCPISDERPVWDVLPEANRAVMEGLDYYIAENVRTARRFLSKAGIARKIEEIEFRELSEHTPQAEVEALVAPLMEGRSAGMLSEAGVPGVADPGALAAALCHRRGIRVVPLVGPCSILLALMASGLDGQSFAFNGYLPVKPDERARALKRLERRAQQERQAQLFIEAPYRNAKLMEQALAVLSPMTLVTVAVDVTAPAERIETHTVEGWRRQGVPDLNKRPALFIIGI